MSANLSAIQNALRSYDPIRTTKAPIEVVPEDGKITLTGHVSTVAMKTMASRLALGVAGVQEVENSLVTDTEIEQTIAWLLSTDDRARLTTDRIKIDVWLGHVMLKGPVLSENIIQAAEKIVRGIPGVTEVASDLYVSDALRAEVEAKARAKAAAEKAATTGKGSGLPGPAPRPGFFVRW